MDSKRILNFAIEKKLKDPSLKSSYDCIQTLLKGHSCVKELLKISNGWIALSDLLTIMILAMDENQLYNKKPMVAASDPGFDHEGKQQDSASDDKAKVHEHDSMEIDPAVLITLEEEFQKISVVSGILETGNA
jgi:hypothetical protein